MRNSLLVAMMCAALAVTTAAQSTNPLVGTWTLLTQTDTTADGRVIYSYGQHPTGFLTYTEDGRMSVIISNEGRKPLSVSDRNAAPVAERAEAFSSLAAYAGRYTFTRDASGARVVHHVEANIFQNAVGSDQERTVTFESGRLILHAKRTIGGVPVTEELIWDRVH